MSRKVKEFIEIRDYTSIDALIEKLIEVRDNLPEASDAEVKMKGDDVFGRQLCISFFRPQTAEEAACDARYAEAYRQSREQAQAEDEDSAVGRRRLRMVA
jgi:hypothetical protein